MNIRDRWEQFVSFLSNSWLKVIVVVLMTACIVQSCLWMSNILSTNKRLMTAVDTATKYAGQVEIENKSLREELKETSESPEVWGLKIMSEIISVRVSIKAVGLPKGKEKEACEAGRDVLRAWAEVIVSDPKAQKLSPQQRSFLIKLVQFDQEFLTLTCNNVK